MLNQKYTVAIEVAATASDIFYQITHNVDKFWPEDVEGSSSELGDEFEFRTGDAHYSKNKVIELVPDKKVVWLVTDSIRKTDNFEWTGTKMIFEIIPKGDTTLLEFTYDGIVLEGEIDRLGQICDIVIKEKLYNLVTNKSYTSSIELNKSAHDVCKAITEDVAKWWGGKDLAGNTTKLNDEFAIHHPGAHYSKQRVVELIPDKKVVWLITESKLSWLKKDMQEWTNTKLIFEITTQENKTLLTFTHEGLVLAQECYDTCTNKGWEVVIKDWLFHFINEGTAHF